MDDFKQELRRLVVGYHDSEYDEPNANVVRKKKALEKARIDFEAYLMSKNETSK